MQRHKYSRGNQHQIVGLGQGGANLGEIDFGKHKIQEKQANPGIEADVLPARWQNVQQTQETESGKEQGKDEVDNARGG